MEHFELRQGVRNLISCVKSPICVLQVGSAVKLWKEARHMKPCQVDLAHFLALLAFSRTFSVVTRSKKPNVLPNKASFGSIQVGLSVLRLW